MFITLRQFLDNSKSCLKFDFERDFDYLTAYDKELILDVLTAYLSASSELAHTKKCGFKFAFVILKSRLRMSLINHKLF